MVVPHVVRSQELTPAEPPHHRYRSRPGDRTAGSRRGQAQSPAQVNRPHLHVRFRAELRLRRRPRWTVEASAEVRARLTRSEELDQDAALSPPDRAAAASAGYSCSRHTGRRCGTGQKSILLNPPGPVITGTTFQVPVVLTGGTDMALSPCRFNTIRRSCRS